MKRLPKRYVDIAVQKGANGRMWFIAVAYVCPHLIPDHALEQFAEIHKIQKDKK